MLIILIVIISCIIFIDIDGVGWIIILDEETGLTNGGVRVFAYFILSIKHVKLPMQLCIQNNVFYFQQFSIVCTFLTTLLLYSSFQSYQLFKLLTPLTLSIFQTSGQRVIIRRAIAPAAVILETICTITLKYIVAYNL